MLHCGTSRDGEATVYMGKLARRWLKLDCVYATVRAGDPVRRIVITITVHG